MFDNIYLKKGMTYIFLVHIFSFITTVVFVLFIPKIFSVSDYGYYQLYLLYISYVGILHFGFFDGLYLRIVGKKFDELNFSNLKSNYFLQLIIQIFICLLFLICFFIYCWKFGLYYSHELFVYFIVIISIPIINIKTFFQYILEATGKTKQYSLLQILDRVFFLSLVFIFYFFNKSFFCLVIADLLSKVFLLALSLLFCRRVIFNGYEFNFNKKDFIINIQIGFKVMLANICGSLLFGISKIYVSQFFDIEIYSQYSLALTFTTLFISIFSSVGVLLLPYIKNKNDETNRNIYFNMHFIVSIIFFCMMIFYYPINNILSYWLFEYKDSFSFLSILFPILYLECEFNFLDNTYLKAYRLEKKLMVNYIISTMFVLVFTTIFAFFYKNIYLISLTLLVSYIIRTFLCEMSLIRLLNINVLMFFADSIFFPLIFVLSNYCIGNIYGVILYIFVLILYLLFFRKSIVVIVNFLKNHRNFLFGAKRKNEI